MIFSVASPTNAVIGVSISGLTLRNANNAGYGGAISAGNYVALNVANDVFNGNSAYEGRAINAQTLGH